MFRQYEDPRALQERLDSLQADLERRRIEEGYELDEYDIEDIESLKERINFAWQDEEYDEMYALYGG